MIYIIFRNINRVLDNNMKKRLDKMGAYFNGCTYKELVEIKIAAAIEHFVECANIISKVFEEIELPKKEIDLERKRIKSEIREDNEKSYVEYQGQKSVWNNTNLSKLITGTNSKIDGIDGDRLKEYAHSILTANNAFIYVTGAVDDEKLQVLADYVGGYKLRDDMIPRRNIAPVPKNFMDRNLGVKIKKGDYCQVRFSFDYDSTVCLKSHMDLIFDILFAGECSKVYDELSEKTAYIYSYSSYLEHYNNIGNLYFSYEVKEKQLLKSIEKVCKILKHLRRGLKDELEYVKPNYVDNSGMDLDDPSKLNWIMAYESHILEQNFKSIEERKNLYKDITAEELTNTIKKIFSVDNMVIDIKVKNKKLKPSDIRSIIKF